MRCYSRRGLGELDSTALGLDSASWGFGMSTPLLAAPSIIHAWTALSPVVTPQFVSGDAWRSRSSEGVIACHVA